ncbi:MAG: EF-P lysine aminoacylase EpmA [Pseudomonadales bacterium]
MAEHPWIPGGNRARWQRRAELFAYLRQFFAERGVLEVDTPVLGRLGVTDPALEAPVAEGGALQTSPEYFMKRLLAAGSGPIYQLARAFRGGEVGRRHNPEFLLLEWYRPGWDDEALRGEMDALLAPLLPGFPAERLPFDALLKQVFGLAWREAPESAWAEALAAHWAALGREGDPLALAEGDPLTILEWLYGEASETLQAPTFITDFPPALASLAALRPGGETAARFELVVAGVELANGFQELCCAKTQRERFEADRARRRQLGKPDVPVDEALLAALEAGLPPCAGVALGVDRVLMLMTGAASLDEVMPFSWVRR